MGVTNPIILKSKANIQKELVSIINSHKTVFQAQRKTKIQHFEKIRQFKIQS